MPTVTLNDKTASEIAIGVSTKAVKQKRFLFITETRVGVAKDVTEKWDFDSIVRDLEGTMQVNVTTDKTFTQFTDGGTDVGNNLIIRVITPKTGTQGLDYFAGYIAQRTISMKAEGDSLGFSAFGHASRLFQAIWRVGTTVKQVFSGAQLSTIVQQIIDNYRTLDPRAKLNYAAGSVENPGTALTYTFEMVTFGDALLTAVDLAYTAGYTWLWRILGDNILTFKRASVGPDHSFIFGRDVIAIDLQEDLVNAANEVFLYFNAATINRYADSADINSHGYISKVDTEKNVSDNTTADALGNSLLNIYNPPVLKITVTIGDVYAKGIELINPGDTCEILNLPTDLAALLTSNMIITKTTYTKDQVTLELTIKQPRLETEVESIRRTLQAQQLQGIPTTYTQR